MVTTAHPIVKDGDVPVFPAIAIPVETKLGFECPSEHLECLREHLGKVTKILIVGWRATERHFLDLLNGSGIGKIPVQVVAANKPEAEEVLGRFTAGRSFPGEAVEGGFTDYVVSRASERFFKM